MNVKVVSDTFVFYLMTFLCRLYFLLFFSSFFFSFQKIVDRIWREGTLDSFSVDHLSETSRERSDGSCNESSLKS